MIRVAAFMNNLEKHRLSLGIIKSGLNRFEAAVAAGQVGQKSLQGIFQKMPRAFGPPAYMAREYAATTHFMPDISRRVAELKQQPGKAPALQAYLLSQDLAAPVRKMRGWMRDGH